MFPQHRAFPPSTGRRAAAARAGMFGRSSLLTCGAAMAAVGGTLFLGGRVFRDTLLAGMHNASTAAISGLSLGDALENLQQWGLWLLVILTVPALLVCLTAAFIPPMLARRTRGTTSVALPEEPAPGLESFLPRAVAALATCLLLLKAFLSARQLMVTATPLDILDGLSQIAASFVVSCAVAWILTGCVEATLRALVIRRALSLDGSDAQREQRSALGPRPRSPISSRERGIPHE